MRKLRWLIAIGFAIALPHTLAAQQAATIAGQVVGEAGRPAPGVTVSIPSLSVGTQTRADGTYTLTVPGARVQAGRAVELRAQGIGFQTQTRSVSLTPGQTTTANFELRADALRLDEIVVTGAGTAQRAVRLGTARATVDSTTIARSNESNIVTALAGKVANVVTHQQSGEAGAATAIRIRGSSTLSGTGQPLFVIDGVPVNNTTRSTANAAPGGSALSGTVTPNPMSQINPNDIESIEILKGPAASSIYGAQAGAGGAILITTKKGRAGQTTYSLRSSLQLDEAANLIPTQQRFGTGTGGVAPVCRPGGPTNCFLSAGFFSWGPELPAGTPTYDHVAELYETGQIWDNSISVSGGSERTTFYLSMGSLNHNGYIVDDNDRFKRYTTRLNASHKLRENLTIGGNGTYAQTDGRFIQRGNSVNGLILGAVRTPAEFNNREYLDPTTGLHRSWRFPNPGIGAVRVNRGFDNPFYAVNEGRNTGAVGRALGNVFANWTALPWLQVNYSLGVDYTSDDRTEAMPEQSSGAALGGVVSRWQFYDRVIDSNLTATATHDFSDALRASVTVGQNLNDTFFRQVFVTGRGLIAPQPFKLANTTTRDQPTDSELRGRLEGYLAQATVDVADQLFLTAGVRNDGSSRFGVNSQRAWYPRGQAAWTFTEAFNPVESLLSFGKLRVAYGESGQQPDFYLLQDVFTNALLNDFNPGSQLLPTLGGVGGIYSAQVRGNEDIKPERVRELEAGFDLSFFDSRIDLNVTNYRQHATDVIFSIPLAPSTGYGFQSRNAAEIENKGWETQLNVRALDRSDFTIDLIGNWARNRNKVLSLGNPNTTTVLYGGGSFGGRTTHAEVGKPLGVFRGFDFARCGRGLTTIGTNNIAAACEGKPDGALYIAANGFPIQDPNEQVIGSPDHDWTAGLGGEVGFHGVRLSAFLDHRQGGTVQNMTKASMYQYGTHRDTEIRGTQQVFGSNSWFSGAVAGPGAGQAVTIGEPWFLGLGGIGGPSAQFQEDATHTRLREVSLAYTFTQPWVRRILGMSSIDARIAGRNLKLWTDYTGFDPEVNLGGAEVGNRGIDWMVNPLSRAWVISVDLNH